MLPDASLFASTRKNDVVVGKEGIEYTPIHQKLHLKLFWWGFNRHSRQSIPLSLPKKLVISVRTGTFFFLHKRDLEWQSMHCVPGVCLKETLTHSLDLKRKERCFGRRFSRLRLNLRTMNSENRIDCDMKSRTRWEETLNHEAVLYQQTL